MNFHRVLKEVFITKLASALGVGPTFYGYFSYDFIFFRDGVEFVLEKCVTDFT